MKKQLASMYGKFVKKNIEIKFCPICGHTTENQILHPTVDNKTLWLCSNCINYIEVYISNEE